MKKRRFRVMETALRDAYATGALQTQVAVALSIRGSGGEVKYYFPNLGK